MVISVDLWTLIGAFAAFAAFWLAGILSLGRMLIARIETNLGERFRAHEAVEDRSRERIDRQYAELDRNVREQHTMHMELLASLPVAYVRRDDYVRGQTVLESKLDALAVRLENATLRTAPRDTP